MSTTQTASATHRWRFFRSGGFDQVRIETADDLRHLGELDQKLWSVLGCPTSGLEFDTRTLQMIDSEGDGQIRSPELIAAVNWTCKVLKDPAVLFDNPQGLPLRAIDDSHPEGVKLLATARQVLQNLGAADADMVTLADLSDPTRLFEPHHYNGDGIIPAALCRDPALANVVEQIMACCGSETDRSGVPGISEALLEAFFAQANCYLEWCTVGADNAADILPLGENTAVAAALFTSVEAKVEDFFTRCRLAAFDARATDPLNPSEPSYVALSTQTLATTGSDIAALPLALVGADKPLPLNEGLNPAWAERMAVLQIQVIEPLLGKRDHITPQEWATIAAKFVAYAAWMATKPVTTVETIPTDTLRTLATEANRQQLQTLIETDRNDATAADAIDQLERAVRYTRDLVTLLRNFVTLSDFYNSDNKAIFQAGTLYLDQRSCILCMRVNDMAKHAKLAPLSGAFLLYCECSRKGEKPFQIVAAMTGGDVDDMLVAGRNGVFYDRQGRDWNATVVKVVENPVSVRQAFWSPYKRIARMISDQIQKFAASRDKAVESKGAAAVADGATKASSGTAPAVPQPFDIAKFAGIFAAIGLALGAIGTALAAVVSGLISLPFWQIPLVFVGVMLLISGPSMLLAWFKLRQRNLGPLLDANGWAVNTRARINIPFGASLTGIPRLPAGASRTVEDRYAEKGLHWVRYIFLVAAIIAFLALWQRNLL
ncbi:hypothetical protein [Chrysiogenes arsenatis]|uniref:hypothetical protein n=1 Tax=Chrysiogenes arsenatis TaxID=309797 RepID=UPI000426CCDD|nr:hypothetical protein [Chrysiogenes arsenatis]